MRTIGSIATALALASLLPTATAGTLLDGRTLLFGAVSSAGGATTTSATVGPAVEFTVRYQNTYGWTADASDTQVLITFTNAQGRDTFWTVPEGAKPFYGLQMTDQANTVAAFASATIQSATLQGFNASRVQVTADRISVDFSGLTSRPGDTVLLQVSGVPEPSQAGLLLLGLAAGGLYQRRRSCSRILSS